MARGGYGAKVPLLAARPGRSDTPTQTSLLHVDGTLTPTDKKEGQGTAVEWAGRLAAGQSLSNLAMILAPSPPPAPESGNKNETGQHNLRHATLSTSDASDSAMAQACRGSEEGHVGLREVLPAAVVSVLADIYVVSARDVPVSFVDMAMHVHIRMGTSAVRTRGVTACSSGSGSTASLLEWHSNFRCQAASLRM